MISSSWIAAGLVNEEDSHLLVDHKKVGRWKQKCMSSIKESFEVKLSDDGVSCIFFYSKIDVTKKLVQDSCSHWIHCKEDHYSVCSEPGGSYLFHFSLEPVQGKKPAEVAANHLFEWLDQKSCCDSIQAIGCDSTNLNTGHNGGIIHLLEKKLEKNLIWLVCLLHTNELPFRHLFSALDGGTSSNNKWAGVIGQKLNQVCSMEIDPDFPPITIGEPLPDLDPETVKNLSTDQCYGYKIVKSIRYYC